MSAAFCSAVFISSGPEREMFNDDLDAGHEEDNKGDESNSTASNKEEIEEPQYGTQQVPDLLPGLHIVKEEQWCDQARHKEHIEEIWQLTSFRRTLSLSILRGYVQICSRLVLGSQSFLSASRPASEIRILTSSCSAGCNSKSPLVSVRPSGERSAIVRSAMSLGN